MGFDKREIVMAMMERFRVPEMKIPEGDKRPMMFLIDSSFICWQHLISKLSNTDPNRDFIGSIGIAFCGKHVEDIHNQMKALSASFDRPYFIVYGCDSAPSRMPKINRTSTHVVPNAMMSKIKQQRSMDRTELSEVLTFDGKSVLSYIQEDSAYRDLDLSELVVDGRLPITALMKATKTTSAFDAWKTLLEHRDVSSGTMTHLYTAQDSVSTGLIGSMMSVPPDRVWESVKKDTRVRRLCIDLCNEHVRNQIIADNPAYSGTIVVGVENQWFDRDGAHPLDASALGEGDDIIMRLTHDPRFNYVIVTQDADIAGYWALHHQYPSSRIFWIENVYKRSFFDLSRDIPFSFSFCNARLQTSEEQKAAEFFAEHRVEMSRTYNRITVLLWIALCNNDFIFTSIATKMSIELIYKVSCEMQCDLNVDMLQLGNMWSFEEELDCWCKHWVECQPASETRMCFDDLICKISSDVQHDFNMDMAQLNNMWLFSERLESWIESWIAQQPAGAAGTYRMVVMPDGKRRKQMLPEGERRKNSSARDILKNLKYWDKKELHLFNKYTV